MPSLFNSLRACLYGAILVSTVVCLAMAAQFQQKLAMTELTRFVPFALFVGSAGLTIFVVLLGTSLFLGARNPISTRIELACLGFAALLWFILGIFLSVIESGDADVECYSAENPTELLDESVASLQTEQYQAMYRVLTAFSLINGVILLLAFLLLLYLALRRHQAGDEHMWHAPVTSCAWFNQYNGKEAPLTTKPERKRPSMNQIPSVLPIAAAYTPAPRRQPSRHVSSRSNNNNASPPTPPTASRSNTKSSAVRNNSGGYGSQSRRPRDIARVYPSAGKHHGRLPSGSAEAPLMSSAMIDGINDGELLDDNPRLERGRRR